MKPSTELHDLIKSLTKSEKRFFKLHSALQSGPKNYLKLFEAIDKQPVYDEEEVKALFKKETFIKHLPRRRTTCTSSSSRRCGPSMRRAR